MLVKVHVYTLKRNNSAGGGRVVRRCWVNFSAKSSYLFIHVVERGPIAFAVGAGGVRLDIFYTRLSFLFPFFPSGRQPDIN